ncbi:MAG TPA: histidine kinase N-terminal 7TM domain-containing protein, partial [Desulfuromonadaceae bacterium]
MPQTLPGAWTMPFYYTPYIILPLLSAVVNAGLAAFALRRRHVPAAQALFWLTTGMGGWSLAYALNTASTSLAVKVLCFKFGASFVCIIAPSLLTLSLESVGLGRWLTRRRLLMVAALPSVMLILAWTSEFHALARYGFYLYTSGPLLLLGYDQGPLFSLLILYIRLVCGAAAAIFISGFWRTPRSEWPRFWLMIAATASPLAVRTVLVNPVRGFDTTTSTLLASGIFYFIAVFRKRLLDLVPIARETLFEMMVEPVLVLDREGRLATANLAARELFLLPRKSGGTPAAAILAPYPQFESLVTDGADAQDGYVLNNGPLNRSWHITKSRIESGDNLHGWIIVMRDITLLHQAQAELRYNEERFRALAENLADTIWQIDDEFRFSYVSSADQAMRGFAPREVIGRSIYDILADEDADTIRRLNKERLAQERLGVRTGTLRYEVQLKRKDKSLVWTEISSNPLRNADGAITSYIGSCRDISGRKQAEEKLLAEKRKLEEALDRLRATEAQLTELNLTLTQQVEQEMEKRLAHERMLARNARLAAMG